MKISKLLLLSFILISLITSCSKSKMKVCYDAKFAKNHNVLIDDTLKLNKDSDSDEYLFVTLTEDKHTLKIDNEAPQVFQVSGNNGFLNITKDEFVIFSVKYVNTPEKWGSMNGLPNIIGLDSFFIGSEITIRALLPSLKKSQMKGFGQKTRDNSELIKITNDVLFIPKTWDIGVNEDIPESMTATGNSESQITAFKKKLITSHDFIQSSKKGMYGFVAVPLKILPD